MRKPVSRLLIFVLTFFIACSMTIKPAQASIWDWLKTQFQSKEATENMQTSLLQEGVSGEKHVTETTSNLMNVVNLHILGAPEGATTSSMLRESVGPGLIGVVSSGIVAMYDPPASSVTYVADVLQNAKIIPQAQAQGLGFAALDPILETWKQFRNVAYLFFVIIFLVIGFMIMFRAKIGQAAITVQQAIPSILVAMLAVTFSYAIAGFLIDLMYLLMFMLVTLFRGEGRDLISGNIFTLIGAMFNSFGDTVRDALTNLMAGLLGDGFVVAALGWLSSLSAIMIIGLAILISAFKIFLELLKSYIAIILQVVFAPIILMVGAFPGKNTFLSWIKNLTGNLVMWPLILICLLVNRMLTSSGYTFNDASVGGFMPPYLLGSGQGAAFPALVGIGILIVIPEIMKEAKKKLGVEEGIMGNLAESAFKRLQQGWKVAEPVLSLGAGGIGAATGAGIGYLGTEGTAEEKMIGAKKGALRGGAIGASAIPVVSRLPKLVKSVVGTTVTQAQQDISEGITQKLGIKSTQKKAETEGRAREEIVENQGLQLAGKSKESKNNLRPSSSVNNTDIVG